MNKKSSAFTFLAAVALFVTDSFRQAVRDFSRVLGNRKVINMTAVRTCYIDDLAQGAEAALDIVMNDFISVDQIWVQAALYGTATTSGIGVKIKVGDKTIWPSGIEISGEGVQSDQDYASLDAFNHADTVGQSLMALCPGDGNNLSKATIYIKNFAAGALNDATVTVLGTRLQPQA